MLAAATILGSGGFVPTGRRETSSLLLRGSGPEADGRAVVIDAGTGLRRLVTHPARPPRGTRPLGTPPSPLPTPPLPPPRTPGPRRRHVGRCDPPGAPRPRAPGGGRVGRAAAGGLRARGGRPGGRGRRGQRAGAAGDQPRPLAGRHATAGHPAVALPHR